MKRKFNRKIKWTAALVGLVIFFGFGIRSVPIGERAIVLGIAIDKAEGLYEVTTQILVSSGSDQSGNGSALITVKHETLSGAFTDIGRTSSTGVALSHCNIVILGKSVLENDAYAVTDYFTRNTYLSENALLAGADNAKEILESKVAFSELSSFYAQRILASFNDYKDVARRTIKDYIVSYYSHNGANWLPYITRIETQKPDTESQNQKGDEPVYVFDATGLSIIKKDSLVTVYDKDSSFAINCVKGSMDTGSMHIEGDNGEIIELYIIRIKASSDYDPEKMLMENKLKFRMLIKEIIPGDTGYAGQEKRRLSESELKRLERDISDKIKKLYDDAASHGVDIYDVYGGMYRSDHKKWREKVNQTGDEYLEKIEIKTEVKVVFE